MQYTIFPMKTVNITQGANSGYSHANLEAWDMAGEDSGIDFWYAPCRIKVLSINPVKGFANTVFFGSCDEQGKPCSVLINTQEAKVLTFSCTHMNDQGLKKYQLEVGKIVQSGEVCYQEGTKGNATGNHIHMEVAEGWQTTKHKRKDGIWETEGIIDISSVFFLLNNFHKVKNTGNVDFQWINEREKIQESIEEEQRKVLDALKETALKIIRQFLFFRKGG